MYFNTNNWGAYDDDDYYKEFAEYMKKFYGVTKIEFVKYNPTSEIINKEKYQELHKSALMILIDGALDRKDQELFSNLIGEYNRLFT